MNVSVDKHPVHNFGEKTSTRRHDKFSIAWGEGRCQCVLTNINRSKLSNIFFLQPWFDDGNIILVTEDQQTAFKIHRGVVSRYSEIFKGMFELPQPNALTDSVEGCQVVPMYDNSVELSRLVKAIYDGP